LLKDEMGAAADDDTEGADDVTGLNG